MCRHFTSVEHSIDRGAQWGVFKPNHTADWERGCRLMTQNDIDDGRLMRRVGVTRT